MARGRLGTGLIVATVALVLGASLLAAGPVAAQNPSPTLSPGGEQPAGPGPPAQVLVAFGSPSPDDPARPCDGVTFKQNAAGATDSIVVCTFDEAGNPSPTDTADSDLAWRIETGNTPPPVGFTSDPPTETTTTGDGTATAEVEATARGEASIVVELLDAQGLIMDRALVEKEVFDEELPDRRIKTRVRAARTRSGIRGTLETKPRCLPGRKVVLNRRSRFHGEYTRVGSTRTGQEGRWQFTVSRPGTYFVDVRSKFLSGGARTTECLSDFSANIRITRRR